MRNGAEYRAYIVGRDGHFLLSKEFVAENDDDALEHAGGWSIVTTLSFGAASA